MESLIGKELVELFEETWIELVNQHNIAAKSICALPLHTESSIVTRVDTCTSIEDMLEKKQEEEANLPIGYYLEQCKIGKLCIACGDKHCMVDCLDGIFHVGVRHPQCESCRWNHVSPIPCDHAKEFSIKWKQELTMWEMVCRIVEDNQRVKPKFYEVDVKSVYEVYKEWLTEE